MPRAFAAARDAGLGLTCHAGEADVGARVLEAAALGATRIGHGIHIVRATRARHASARASWACTSRSARAATCTPAPPRRWPRTRCARMLAAGLSVSVSTDNRLMSGVSLSSELQALHEVAGLSLAQIRQMHRAAAAASFMPQPARAAALAALGPN